jgi:hypothetical protein
LVDGGFLRVTCERRLAWWGREWRMLRDEMLVQLRGDIVYGEAR